MKMDKEKITNFINELEQALTLKQEWFNNEKLPEILQIYRMHYTCVKNLNEILIKKSLIEKDPYKLDKRISDIVVTETESFPETETAKVLGSRLSDYEMMLDYICTYLRFSTENLDVGKIKTLLELCKVFDWANISTNSASANTRALAKVVSMARLNASQILISNVNDSMEKSEEAINKIIKTLSELVEFQREFYKGRLRKDIFEHPEFNVDFALQSKQNELTEIKRMYVKVIGKKNFYVDLVNEIIEEDQSDNAEKLQQIILKKLEIKTPAKEIAKKNQVNSKDLLIAAVNSIGFLAPVMGQFLSKLNDNFDLLFYEKKNFFTKLKDSLRKMFGIPAKERICNLPIVNSQTGIKTITKINVSTFLDDINRKYRIYSGIVAKGPEYSKILSAKESDVVTFLNNQIKENQQLFTTINSLDDYFKATVEILLRPKLKGLKIDLSGYRNIIIDINKKRGEYASFIEEQEQMRRIGMSNV